MVACAPEPASVTAPPLRFLHTFGAGETEALNELLAARGGPQVETSQVPFSRGQGVIGALLSSGQDCPDLVRIDATWLPGLVQAGLLSPAPAEVAGAEWIPEAAELARAGDTWWAVPQAVDGLLAAFRPAVVPELATPPSSLDQLIAAATAAQRRGAARHAIGLRGDGYWLIPFLRAAGAEIDDGTLGLGAGGGGTDAAVGAGETAVAAFAALFAAGIAAPPAPAGAEEREEPRRFRAGEVAVIVTGPWALDELTGGDLSAVAVTAVPGAPRGGQVLVVPRCARAPDEAWALAAALTAPALEASWARRFGMVPSRAGAFAGAGAVAGQVRDALRPARPLPRHPRTALLFDDLNPALAAVVAGDATPAEALEGVRRAWARLEGDATP